MPDAALPPVVTKHGAARIAERLGCGRKGAERAARIAHERGIRHADTTGKLRRYLDKKAKLHIGEAGVFVVHGNYVFIFNTAGQVITMHLLPGSLRRRA